MRWSRAVALVVVGVLVSQLAPASSVRAEDPEDLDLPPGTIVMIGEITAADDFGVHNFLTGLKTEEVAAEYSDYRYKITENEFQLLLFPEGLLIGEGIVERNVEARYRLWWPGREEYTTWHVAFTSSIEFTIEATWDGNDFGEFTGTFEMSAAPTVRVNEATTPSLGIVPPCSSVAEGAPCAPGDPNGQVEVQAPHSTIGGTVQGVLPTSPGGQLDATLTAGDEGFPNYPGLLVVSAIGVHVEPGAPGRGGLLLGEGPHGVDLREIVEAFGGCEGRIEWGPAPTRELTQWEALYFQLTKEAGLGFCHGITKALGQESRADMAANIVAASHLFSTAKDPKFLALKNTGVLRVLAVLGDRVKANPDDTRAFTALVKFFNFNLRINAACEPEDCPA